MNNNNSLTKRCRSASPDLGEHLFEVDYLQARQQRAEPGLTCITLRQDDNPFPHMSLVGLLEHVARH